MADRSTGAFGDLDKAAADLEKRLAGIRRGAENLIAEEDALTRRRTGVQQRLEEEVRRGRVSQRTVGGAEAGPGRGANVAEEARAQRSAASRTRAIGTEQQALANLTRTRESDLRSLQRFNRLGPYSATRNISELQLQQQRLAQIQASARTGVTPILSGIPGGGGGGGGGGYRPPTGGGGEPPERQIRALPPDIGAKRAAQDIGVLRQEEGRLIQTFNSGSLAIRRHGALTTEFFQEAARGTVTIRELGYQTASTIGKFGGWIVAGSAVFGAAAAVGQLARGALDASSGVNDLQRVMNNVDASKLRGQFSDLAEHFNVPIADASQAVYQMGKVFKDQDQAVSAAATALYAVKIGEIDVATATRYLTSIVQGANLSTADMAVLFDQVNKAQNQFGVSIDSTLAGLAKATGSYRNLGGNVQRYLLPLIAAAQRLTGQTGDVAGTAFQRIPNYLAQANNQATLRQAGINARDPIDKILQEALNKSKSGQFDKDQLREVAYAIFGHFYGPRIGVPLLQNPERVAQYQQQLQPEAARGSAERELQQLLGSIQERIIRIGTELQRMGDKLVDSGLVDVIGVAVVGLGQLLTITNVLLDNFNDLPEPLRKGLSYALELGIALRAAQRFQLGGSILGQGQTGVRGGIARALGSEQTPIVQGRAARKQLADQATYFEETRNAEARNAALASRTAQVARVRIGALEDQIVAGRTAGAAQSELNVLEQQLAAQKAVYTRSLQASAAADAGQRAAEAERQAVLSQSATLRGPGGLRSVREAPGAGAAIGRAAQVEAETANGLVLPPGVNSTMAEAESNANKAQAESTRLRSRVGSFLRGYTFLGVLGDLGFAAFVGYEAGQILSDQIEKWYSAVTEAAAAPRTYAAIKEQLPALHTQVQDGVHNTFADITGTIADALKTGNTPLGQVAALPFDFASNEAEARSQAIQLQRRLREGQLRQIAYQQQVFQGLRSGDYGDIPRTPQEAEHRVQLQQLEPGVRAGLRAYGRFFDGLGHLGEGIKSITKQFGGGDDDRGAGKDIGDLFNRAADGDKKAAQALARLRRRRPGQFGSELGRQQATILQELYSDSQGQVDVQGLTGAVGGVLSNFKQVADRLSAGKLRERAAEIRGLLKNAGIKPEDAQALQQELQTILSSAALASGGRGFGQRLKLIKDPDTLQKLLEAQQSLQDIGRPEGTIHRAQLVYQRIVEVLKGSHNPEDLKKIAEARQALADVLGHQLDLIQARGALRESGINEAVNPVAKQRAALNTLQQQLHFMQAHRKAFDLKDILGVQAQINDAETQLAETIRQQAEDIAHAQFDVARARAGENDVKTAKIDIQQALYDLGHARTPQERLQAQADLINARRQLQENIATRQIDDIQFQADIGKLTLDQQIAAYRRLLRTAELTRDQRRDLKRRIHQLREETDSDSGGFELDVGNIKLPTIYEIRRAIGGGYGAGGQVNMTNAPNINVNVADPNAAEAVGAAIDNSLNTSTGAAMRQAGLI